MLILDTPTRSLEVILAAAKQTSDCPWQASYENTPTSRVAHSQIPQDMRNAIGVTNGVAAVTIMAGHGLLGAGFGRMLRSFTLANADTIPQSVTIRLNDNGTTRAVIGPMTLDVNETLSYEETGRGWHVLDVAGSIKTTPDAGNLAATSKANSAAATVSTASSAASLANSLGASDGLAASVASSAASLSGSKADSDGLAASTASSAASLANTKATSAGTSASVASSAASLADSKGSNAQSRALSAGW